MDNKGAGGSVVTIWQLPHPPVAVPEVGRGREGEIPGTSASMRAAADYIAGLGPDTLIVISPHAPAHRDRIFVNGQGTLKGDLGRFGARGAAVEFEGDGELAGAVCAEAAAAGINVFCEGGTGGSGGRGSAPAGRELDHGAVVPLYFINKAIGGRGIKKPKLLVVSIAYLDNAALFKFGGCIASAIRKNGRRAALIASGDLSHKLTESGPYGFDPAGPEFDRHIVNCMAARDVRGLLETDEMSMEKAAQCGFYGLAMAYGALGDENTGSVPGAESHSGAGDSPCAESHSGTGDSPGAESVPGARGAEILSYEGVFGVGYAVARLL